MRINEVIALVLCLNEAGKISGYVSLSLLDHKLLLILPSKSTKITAIHGWQDKTIVLAKQPDGRLSVIAIGAPPSKSKMCLVAHMKVLALFPDHYRELITIFIHVMANFSRVAEIFEQASVAFSRLAQLTLDLKQFQAQQNDGDSKTCGKWSQKEVDDLKAAIGRFGADLSKVAEAIETKTINQIKQKLKTRGFQVERGRRKQALSQIPEPVDVHPAKRSKSTVDDSDEYANYDTETENISEKSRQHVNTVNSNSVSHFENNGSNNTNDKNMNSVSKRKTSDGTLSCVLSKRQPFVNSDVRSFDGRHLKTTPVTNSIGSGYDANESKYEDYDSDDSNYGAGGGTPEGDYESDEEQEEEEEDGEEEEANRNQDYDDASSAN
ncbi:unnamed protein product [Heterobilharzia americana]|nr:unnamed protein product [Heterobilharzia americana]